jgi:hypothetical protein
MTRPNEPSSDPEKRARDLRREFSGFDKEPPGPERAVRLAAFTRAAHADRQLNMAMHTATMCLADDPDAPTLLVAAYLEDEAAIGDERLHALADLRDLARYVDRPDIATLADEQLRDEALAWVTEADDSERRYRLRRVQSVASRELADDIRDRLAGR